MSSRTSRFATQLAKKPIHGRDGRIAAVRRRLRMPQSRFAQRLREHGGRVSRETVSHWENLDPKGEPRARMSRRNAHALASLAASHRLALPPDLFIERHEKPWETLARLQEETAAQLDHLSTALDNVVALVERRALSKGSITANDRPVILRISPDRVPAITYRSVGGVVERVWSE